MLTNSHVRLKSHHREAMSEKKDVSPMNQMWFMLVLRNSKFKQGASYFIYYCGVQGAPTSTITTTTTSYYTAAVEVIEEKETRLLQQLPLLQLQLLYETTTIVRNYRYYSKFNRSWTADFMQGCALLLLQLTTSSSYYH